ncbi:MAG: AbrB/MazE/SpoVT family DNA-binding domain-containing protein [Nanoarchaeota archaeon]|nr:AbrB/MazE/SpoVT family DNA-binding domain-containing protein [Nanoarchaeota archaeon]
MQIAVTRMSSKGQVVIPAGMRIGIEEGEDMVIIRSEGRIILEKATKAAKKFKEDFEFAKRTEEAMKRYEKGGFIEMSGEDFLEELKKW